MKTLAKKLSIVILNYNSGDFLIRCLKSLKLAEKELCFEVFVVDNDSSDDSFKEVKIKFPQFQYIQNETNLGFSKGNNVALRKVTSEYVLLLNPDSEVLPGTLKFMVDFMDSYPEAGAASCRVELNDGSLDWASHRGFPTPWTSFKYYLLKDESLYHLTKNDMKKPHEVDVITGAFFLTRKSVLDKVGLFDEDYFMYAEDIDLCYRIKQAGYKIMYVPEVIILHHKGVSSGIKRHSQTITTADKQSREKALNAFYETMAIFYKKHLARKYPFFVNWLVYLGINLKWAMAKRKLQV